MLTGYVRLNGPFTMDPLGPYYEVNGLIVPDDNAGAQGIGSYITLPGTVTSTPALHDAIGAAVDRAAAQLGLAAPTAVYLGVDQIR